MKARVNIKPNSKRLKAFSKIRHREERLHLRASVQRSTESSQSNMRKRHKATQIRREGVKSPLFPDDVILYVANAEDSGKKKKTVRKIFRKVGGCRLPHRNQLPLSALTDPI